MLVLEKDLGIGAGLGGPSLGQAEQGRAVLPRQEEGQLDRPFRAVLHLQGLDSQMEIVLQGSWSLVELLDSLC